MDQIHALNASSGQAIPDILSPTFKIFAPILVKNQAEIQSIPLATHSYGPHPRQTLDLIRSPSDSGSSPVVIFLHGGGLVRGDKNSPQVPHNLVYHNVGTFFAKRGITAININYRRVNSSSGGEDAVFPSGGEDVAAVLKWLDDKGEKRDVYLLGNSAGGLHATTFVLGPSFLEERKKYTSGSSSITLKGLIDVAVPFHFKSALPSRAEVNAAYYGDAQAVSSKAPYGLLEAIAKEGKTREELGIPKTLVLLGEYDPENEIGEPTKDFMALWKKTWGDDGLRFDLLEGHNHISPPWSLLSGDAKGEKWGELVAAWIRA